MSTPQCPSPSFATQLVSTQPTSGLSLYLVKPRHGARVLVAATDEVHARSYPPFSNWRTLLKFGGWSPSENARARVTLVGMAVPGVEAGPLMFEGS